MGQKRLRVLRSVITSTYNTTSSWALVSTLQPLKIKRSGFVKVIVEVLTYETAGSYTDLFIGLNGGYIDNVSLLKTLGSNGGSYSKYHLETQIIKVTKGDTIALYAQYVTGATQLLLSTEALTNMYVEYH